MSGVVIIKEDQFEAEVLRAKQPVLVYFWATWCGPCLLMAPVVESLASLYGDRLKLIKMEVDPNRSVVAQYKVEGVPAFRLFREGEMIAALEGAVVKQKLLDLLNPYVPA